MPRGLNTMKENIPIDLLYIVRNSQYVNFGLFARHFQSERARYFKHAFSNVHPAYKREYFKNNVPTANDTH